MDNLYNLSLDKIIESINRQKAKRVLIQLADGLKPRAGEIADKIEQNTPAEVLIWFGSCYGACDLPVGIDRIGVDLIIQFGHTKFNKSETW